MSFQGTAKVSAAPSVAVSNPTLNPSLVKWMGGITLAIVIIIVIVVVVLYFTRKGPYTPYKAKPAPASETNVYYPNGKPDPETGKPPTVQSLTGSKQGVSNTLTSNLNSYKSYMFSASDWGAVPNSN